MSDNMLIDCLGLVADELSKEAKQKKEWGGFGNPHGQFESKRLLQAASEILKAIAEAI